MRIAAAAALAAALLLAPVPLRAGEGNPAAAKEWKALQAEEAASKAGYKEKYLAFQPRYEAFAKKHAGTEESLSAKLWLLGNTWWHREEGTMTTRASALADEILQAHPDSEQLARVPDFHYAFAPADRDRIFTRLAEGSKHAAVRGSALLRLALASPAEKRKSILERLGKEYAETPYRYTTLGELAAAHLSPHPASALEIGQPAPEIEGKTEEGKPMRLSDYRGKVVVVDFFGDW